MKYAYDIHIHSVLSSCSDELMTPNNILNMASLNELDIVAVTDHNSMKQLNTIYEIAESYDFIVIPGVEIQTEGGHVLAYLPKDEFHLFDEEVEKHILNNQSDCEQVLMDVYDIEVGQYQKKLSGDVSLNLLEVLMLIKKYKGVAILAHINKDSYSLKKVVTDKHIQFIDGIEVTSTFDETFLNEYPLFKEIPVYRNSDAHTITSISRRVNFIELDELTIESFLKGLGR